MSTYRRDDLRQGPRHPLPQLISPVLRNLRPNNLLLVVQVVRRERRCGLVGPDLKGLGQAGVVGHLSNGSTHDHAPFGNRHGDGPKVLGGFVCLEVIGQVPPSDRIAKTSNIHNIESRSVVVPTAHLMLGDLPRGLSIGQRPRQR